MEKNIYDKNMKFGDFLGKGLDIFINNINYILIIAAIVYIPINIILYYAGSHFFSSPNFTFEDFSNFTKVAGWLENLLGVLASIFVIFLAKGSIDGKKNTFNELFNKALSKWGVGILGNILYSIGVGLLLILLIIPGLIFSVYWLFFLYVLVLKGLSINDSFTYSKKLVSGRWWEILGYGMFMLLGFFVLGVVSTFIPYVDNIIVSILTDSLIDLFGLFMIIVFTLKFLNIDSEFSQSSGNNGDDKKYDELEIVNKKIEL